VTAVVYRSYSMRRRALVNATDVALYFWRAHRVRIKPATIRQWAHRRHIPSHGFRRERYDLREVVAYARAQGIIPNNERRGRHRGEADRGERGG
jgi:hypothetical protein